MANDVSKLPRWAQDHIRQLEIRNHVLEQQLQPESSRETRVYRRIYLNRGEEKAYYPEEEVTFQLRPHLELRVRLVDNHLHIHGSGVILLVLDSANSLTMGLSEFGSQVQRTEAQGVRLDYGEAVNAHA